MKVSRNKLLGIFLGVVAIIFIALFFSYRLLEVPSGLTVDEAAFGYNAVLLSETGRDQNGRFLPIFVLSIDGKDWRQPVTQYYLAGLFKVFGASVYGLRFSSVIITIISTILLFFLTSKLLSTRWAIFSSLIFLTTPLVMIQSHMGLDNIMPIPFTIIWLYRSYLFTKTQKKRYLVLSALSLGINFYTYKAMRAAVPVWVLVTIGYILIYHYKDHWFLTIKKSFKDILVFSLSVFPFFAVIPFLEMKYAGAILGGSSPSFSSIYSVIYPYFSSFDITFMYIMGDLTKFHSTQQHGMMLLATAPLFFTGLYYAVRRKGFWAFVLISYFSAPLLFGLVGSTHRASRLMMLIPLYSLLVTLGAKQLWENIPKIYYRSSLILIILLMVINYTDFVNYYWFTYPKFTEEVFGHLDYYKSYEKLAKEASARNLAPYIVEDIASSSGESGRFFEAIYFEAPTIKIHQDEIPPQKSILMTHRENVPEMNKLPMDSTYYLQIKE